MKDQHARIIHDSNKRRRADFRSGIIPISCPNFMFLSHKVPIVFMKVETIQVDLPKEIVKSAEEAGISKEKIREMLKSFAVLEITANLSKLDKKEAESISKSVKAVAWKKTKKKLGI